MKDYTLFHKKLKQDQTLLCNALKEFSENRNYRVIKKNPSAHAQEDKKKKDMSLTANGMHRQSHTHLSLPPRSLCLKKTRTKYLQKLTGYSKLSVKAVHFFRNRESRPTMKADDEAAFKMRC